MDIEGIVPRTPVQDKIPKEYRPRVSRSLFGRDSFESCDEPTLSPSSEESTPNSKSIPIRVGSLSLDSPEVKVRLEGPTSKMKGIKTLSFSSGISPSKFYGSNSVPKMKKYETMTQPPARTRLHFEEFAKTKKRGRSSSGGKIKPHPKRVKSTPRPPIPMLGQIKPKLKKKKKIPKHSENKQTKENVAKTKSITDDNASKATKSPKVIEQQNCVNWNINFTKAPRLMENGEATPIDSTKKFFKSSQPSTPKIVRQMLTPPVSKRRNRLLYNPDDAAWSPKNRKVIVKDMEELAKDESSIVDQETNTLIDNVISNLCEEPITNQNIDSLTPLPSPEESDEAAFERQTAVTINTENTTESKDQENSFQTKYYPIFNSQTKKPLCENLNQVASNYSDKKKKNKIFLGKGEDQYQIDSGQKNLAEVYCSECNLFYTHGCPEDEIIHKKHHSSNPLFTYIGWKNERVVGLQENDKIISVMKNDSKSWWRKVKNIVSYIDEELGFPSIPLDELRDPQVFLYVSNNKNIIGCLVCESIQRANKLLSDEGSSIDVISEEDFNVKVGVSRIWVNSAYRRKKIGTSLLNSLRKSFMFGVILKTDDLAFTVPTNDGKRFIANYMGKSDFFVYV